MMGPLPTQQHVAAKKSYTAAPDTQILQSDESPRLYFLETGVISSRLPTTTRDRGSGPGASKECQESWEGFTRDAEPEPGRKKNTVRHPRNARKKSQVSKPLHLK